MIGLIIQACGVVRDVAVKTFNYLKIHTYYFIQTIQTKIRVYKRLRLERKIAEIEMNSWMISGHKHDKLKSLIAENIKSGKIVYKRELVFKCDQLKYLTDYNIRALLDVIYIELAKGFNRIVDVYFFSEDNNPQGFSRCNFSTCGKHPQLIMNPDFELVLDENSSAKTIKAIGKADEAKEAETVVETPKEDKKTHEQKKPLTPQEESTPSLPEKTEEDLKEEVVHSPQEQTQEVQESLTLELVEEKEDHNITSTTSTEETVTVGSDNGSSERIETNATEVVATPDSNSEVKDEKETDAEPKEDKKSKKPQTNAKRPVKHTRKKRK